MQTIGLGGSCHWCTEAIFASLKGVQEVQQGWIASDVDGFSFSEAVIVEFDPDIIPLQTLIAIHLYTHSCTSDHAMRSRYRSAVYTFKEEQVSVAAKALKLLQSDYADPIITRLLPFKRFRVNEDKYLNYYYNDPEKPFCKNIVNPKLRLLMLRFGNEVNGDKLGHLSR